MTRYVAESRLPVSQEQAFAYHERPGCLQRLTPPWESVSVEKSDGTLQAGSRVVLKTSLFGVPLRWVARHTVYDPPSEFADVQESGPFARWEHRHRFVADDQESSRLIDEVAYTVPAGSIGNALGGGVARGKIESMFAYRHRVTRDDLELAAGTPLSPQRVAISGASGMVGDALSSMMTLLGHDCRDIVRDKASDESEIGAWSDDDAVQKFEQVDAVVHLAGKPIASERWTDEVKQQIRRSRVDKTRDLCETLAKCTNKPKVLICASASGIYGDRGDEILTEDSEPGDDFLADVASQWESACRPAVEAGIRVVNARFGLILSPAGGALEKMLTPAKFCGGKLGSGNQFYSWIALDDVLGGIYHCIANDSVSGPVNFVSPEPIRNRDFATILGRVLGRPSLFPAPSAALRLGLGEMADALLLSSTAIIPKRLSDSGYRFRFTDLTDQLSYCLGKHRLPSSTSDPNSEKTVQAA
ncbi:TIGR01777 family oxidoreductase [Crateriforma conspicua]|uniref:Epimerase family protein n=1 Tax=Crateriforma conspicua TaxID=2527996 RepID=A0A5C6G029_9PLAN|nr:TIGR01777 family oxidoreductase [Crateriforma conspicua]TWU66968.1 Epimerase family protein [Crateriforma conspicua]